MVREYNMICCGIFRIFFDDDNNLFVTYIPGQYKTRMKDTDESVEAAKHIQTMFRLRKKKKNLHKKLNEMETHIHDISISMTRQ